MRLLTELYLLILAAVSLYLIIKCLGSNVILKVAHQRNEVGQCERQPDVDGVLVSLNRTQLLVVSPFFEQVVDETLLLISAPTAWHAHTHTHTHRPWILWYIVNCVLSGFHLRLRFQAPAAAVSASAT